MNYQKLGEASQEQQWKESSKITPDGKFERYLRGNFKSNSARTFRNIPGEAPVETIEEILREVLKGITFEISEQIP